MGIGVWQVVLVLVIVLIIFGAGKLPRVMGDVAKGIKNFKSGMAEETDKPVQAEDKGSKAIDADAPAAADGGDHRHWAQGFAQGAAHGRSMDRQGQGHGARISK